MHRDVAVLRQFSTNRKLNECPATRGKGHKYVPKIDHLYSVRSTYHVVLTLTLSCVGRIPWFGPFLLHKGCCCPVPGLFGGHYQPPNRPNKTKLPCGSFAGFEVMEVSDSQVLNKSANAKLALRESKPGHLGVFLSLGVCNKKRGSHCVGSKMHMKISMYHIGYPNFLDKCLLYSYVRAT